MHERLDADEKKRALIGSVVAALGCFVLGWVSLPGGSTPLLAAYFGAGILFSVLAVSFGISLRS